MFRRGRVLCGAFALAAVLATPAGASITSTGSERRAPVGGTIGIRLVDVPAAARTDPRAQVYIVDQLAPGATIRRRIEVSNSSPSDERVALYTAAATIAHGSFVGGADHARNDLSTWATIRPGSIDVGAGARVTTDVTISIPTDATPGEQYAVVWAEVRSAPAQGGGVTQVGRVGIRLYISVGTGGPRASDFTIDSLTARRSTAGAPMIVATVRNTGGRALDMKGSLQLSGGPGGLSAGPFRASLGTTLALGDTEPVTIPLDARIPAGPWRARVTLRSGLLERSVEATVTFPNAGAAPAVAITTGHRGWLRPVAITAGVPIALGIAVLLIRGRRPRLARPPDTGSSTDLGRSKTARAGKRTVPGTT